MELGVLSDRFFERKINKEESDVNCLRRSLKRFCETGKKEDAFCVYFCFCEIFMVFGKGYDTMSKLLEFLSDHEYHSGELISKHRDHYSHSVYVFALGLAIYANDKTYEKIIADFYKDEGFSDTYFLYLWGLTSLFHDVGYPFQLAHEQIKSYTEELWGKEKANAPFVSYESMDWLLALNDRVKAESKFNSLNTIDELLAYGINYRLKYPLHVLLKLMKNRYEHQRAFMDHGYFSAILLAHQLTCSETALTEPILDVLTAISLHNSLNRYDLAAELKEETAVASNMHPLAYLLMLCDELQNWDRTAFGYVSRKDPLAWKVDIEIEEGKLAIDYVFDTFTVVDSEVVSQARRSDRFRKTQELCEVLRTNKNVEDLRKGDFIDDINEVVRPHTQITVRAFEQKKERNGKMFASSDRLVNLCDFAVAIHSSYQSLYGGDPFSKLPLEFKLSNIEQATSYDDKLELINCFYSEKELDYPIVKGFTHKDAAESDSGMRDDLGFLAREEHLRWVREKLNAGWHYGDDYKDNEERNRKKIHRDIIPFDFLPETEQNKDKLMIQNMVPFLYRYGHGVRIYSYRTGWKPVLDIAACGHRTVNVNDQRIRAEVKRILSEYQKTYRVIVRTNFAFGADMLVADVANELGITLKAAIPFRFKDFFNKIREDAEKTGYPLTAEDELKMRELLAQVVTCKEIIDPKYTYFEAAKYILGKCKKLIAVWDGIETVLEDEKGNPVNQGGTYHSICIAKNSRGLRDEDIHIIPCHR